MMTILIRWAVAFFLMAATYNPTSYNWVAWAMRDWAESASLIVFSGLVLVIGYVIFLRATLRSIGPIGMMLVLALAGAMLWVLADFGLISLENPTVNTWIALVILSGMLGVGLSWSIVRRKLSGQVDADDVDEA